jgi:hypothetical protein
LRRFKPGGPTLKTVKNAGEFADNPIQELGSLASENGLYPWMALSLTLEVSQAQWNTIHLHNDNFHGE